MNTIVNWGIGALVAGGLTAGAVTAVSASSTHASALPPTAQAGSGRIAHLKDVKHQLDQQLAAKRAAEAAARSVAPTPTVVRRASSVTVADPSSGTTEETVPTTAPVPTTSPTPTTVVSGDDDQGSDSSFSDDQGENDDNGVSTVTWTEDQNDD